MDRIATLSAFLVQKPDDRFSRYSLALELKKVRQTALAIAEFQELLRRHPTSGAGHYQLGLLFQEEGDEVQAREAWEAGLKALSGSDDPEARRSTREITSALASL